MGLNHYINGIPLAAGTNSGLPYIATISGIAATGGTVDAVVTTAAPHLLADNQLVTIASVTTATGLNATWPIKVLTPTTFALVGSASVSGTPGGSPTYSIPTLDISGIVNPNLMIQANSDAGAVLEIQDSVDNFSGLVRRKIIPIKGEVNLAFNFSDFGDYHRFGTGSARLRVVCVSGSFSRVAVQTRS